MATSASPTTRNEVAVLQADALPFDQASAAFDPIPFEKHLESHADWAELIEIVRSANELVRLARALVPVE
jgi:hypothetical protein